MLSFKINFTFVCSILLGFTLQAEGPVTDLGSRPPFEINIGDTSSFTYYELDSVTRKVVSEKIGIVEDTILPPCDIIFYKSGKLEYCKIIETTPTTITYKMCDYLDGPNVVVNKSDIHKIRYANGKEEVIVPSQTKINAYVKARKDPMSTWALICSIAGLLFIPALIAGIVLGFISLGRIKRSEGALRGKGTAKAAIIVGLIIAFLTILLYI